MELHDLGILSLQPLFVHLCPILGIFAGIDMRRSALDERERRRAWPELEHLFRLQPFHRVQHRLIVLK
jgi:hypothetical protein